jgi:DnaJ-class molecular chaperone
MAPSDESGSGAPSSLFDYSEEDLLTDNKLTHYEILNVPHHATPDQVKKAYRKASLKYHPDKTGRGQEDYVFLAVKRAYDHLMDPVKRQVSA